MDTCLNCGGAIGEPGKTYGYAGKWCHCPVNPQTQFQKPARAQNQAFVDELPKRSMVTGELLQQGAEEFDAFPLSTAFRKWEATHNRDNYGRYDAYAAGYRAALAKVGKHDEG